MKQNLLSLFIITTSLFLFQDSTAQRKLRVEKFLQDTIFSAIAVADNGDVFAGTTSKGFVHYDKKDDEWKDWDGLLSPLLKLNIRQIVTTNDSVWIATSGYPKSLGTYAGINKNVLGGVHLMQNRSALKKNYYMGASVAGLGIKDGPPTRNVVGVCIDQYGRPWTAAGYHDSTTYTVTNQSRYYFSPGSVARFDWEEKNFKPLADDGMPNPTGITIGGMNANKEDNYSFGKRKGCRSIASINGEIWAGNDGYEESPGNIIYSGIVRYDTDGNFLGKYDENNTGLPFGLTNNSQGPWSIFQDSKGRVWIALPLYRGLAVLDTDNQWTYIGLPTMLNGEQVVENAMAEDENGNIYFGTNAGLLIYDGVGDFLSASSYDLWTMADGLSSNSINGVAIGKDQVIWLATGRGVNKIIRGDFTVYNLYKDVESESIQDNDDFRRLIAFYNSDDPQTELDKDTLFVAADGRRATLFKWIGSNAENIRFRIKDDILPTANQDKYGKFEYIYDEAEHAEKVFIRYHHPSYIEDAHLGNNGTDVRLQVVDESASPEIILMDIPVKFVLPPVLMVHGLWSEGATWQIMKDYLHTNLFYQYKPHEISAPSYPNDRHFIENRVHIHTFINDLLRTCSENRISAGAVDIVAHSMGGILSRLYLQEGEGAPVYDNNIHKLITINTPHSGSPLANIVEAQGRIFKWVVKNAAGDPTKGALGDLSIGKAPIEHLLNGFELNKNIVPSHAIHSTAQLGHSAETFWWVTQSNPFFEIIPLYVSGLFGCRFIDELNECLETAFNGLSDLIVSDESQIGGLNDAETYFTGYSHTEVYKELPVISRVFELLQAKTTSGDFSLDGFQPVKLKWNPSRGTQHARRMASTLEITSPGYGDVFNRGDSVHIQINAGSDIARMMLLVGYENQLGGTVLEAPESVFSFKIPDDVLDRVNYLVFGFTESGEVFSDSSYIIINADPSIVLDSIKIKTVYDDELKVTIEDSVSISLIGYFSDGFERDLTFSPGITFSTLTNSVSLEEEGFVKGLVLGYDELKIGYGGFYDSLDLEVIPKKEYDTAQAGTVPVTFSGISARFNGSEIKVEWNTSSEQNNQYFEIEHSADGQTFSPVGRVTARNLPNGSSYNFYHGNYASGNNYYRIKQVDWDGKFSYSITVIAIVNVQNNIVVYPNPVQDLLNIDFSRSGVLPGALKLRISNSFGQTIMMKNIEGGESKITLSLAGLPAGIYTLQVIDTNEKNVITEKIIKNR